MPLIEIKADKEGIYALESSIIRVLEACSSEEVSIKALDVLQKGSRLETTITDCTLTAENVDCEVASGEEYFRGEMEKLVKEREGAKNES